MGHPTFNVYVFIYLSPKYHHMKINSPYFLYEKDTTYNEDKIKIKFKDVLRQPAIDEIIDCYRWFREIVDLVSLNNDYEEWFAMSFQAYVRFFVEEIFSFDINNIRPDHRPSQKEQLELMISAFRKFCLYGEKNFQKENQIESFKKLRNEACRLPDLKAYLDIAELKNLTTISDEVQVIKTEIESRVALKEKELNEKLEAADRLIEKLDIESSKLAVKHYADIFEAQALEYSVFNNHEKQKKWYNRFVPNEWGNAQRWLTFAIIALVVFVTAVCFRLINSAFLIPESAQAFTPFIVVNMVGRVLLLSLGIFVISFAFKQYRVNKHLHTLNKHRANTLKSFEYLTQEGKMNDESYNAILREVAKAIYEAGQTGYVNTNDTNADIPSIVDMTKIIHSPK